jgi:hypothetical protein
VEQFERMGIPTIDALLAMPLDEPSEEAQMELARRLLGKVPEGITHFIFHPSIDTPELRAIAPDWESRVANYHVFMNDEMKTILESEDIKLVGYRALREALQNP